MVCLPLVLLGLAETTLRLFGLGGYEPMLRRVGQVEGGTLVIADQGGASSWFFASPTLTGRSEQHTFLDPKPPNTIRIFLVGASVIEGYPQSRHLAASAFLESMLQDAWPDRRVEVINLGATAIASFPVLGIMTEALEYEPDLIVVHTGHNEFFGAYGVASTGGAGSRPWMLKAARLIHSSAIMQGSNILLHKEDVADDRTLMESMMGRRFIGPSDRRRRAAASNLYHNVAQMIERCQAAGVPVLVCTQPSNEKDLAPVGTDKLDSLPLEVTREVETQMSNLEKQTPFIDPVSAETIMKGVLELAPHHARAHYLLGRALRQQERHAEALEQFEIARDVDPLPWRAPTLSQEAVLRAAKERNAPVCDLVKAFHEASPEGIIGWELMDDHVHPTLRGQALTAETIVDSLAQFDGRLHVSPEARARIVPWTEYATRLGENIYDQYAVAHSMRILFAAPFMRKNNPDAFERFNVLAEDIESLFSPEVRAALDEWQETEPFAGARCPVTAAVAQQLVKEGDYEQAHELYQIALRAVPKYTSWHLEYVYYSLYCRHKLAGSLSAEEREIALQAIQQGRFLCDQFDSDNGFNARYTGFLHLLCNQFAEAIPFLNASRNTLSGIDRLAVDQALIVCLLKTGRFDEARTVAATGAAQPGGYASRYEAILKELPALIESASSSAQEGSPGAD